MTVLLKNNARVECTISEKISILQEAAGADMF